MPRGGHRAGAGRKPKGAPKPIKIYLPDLVWQHIRAKGKPPEQVIAELVARAARTQQEARRRAIFGDPWNQSI